MSRTCTLNTANYMYIGNSVSVDQLAGSVNGQPGCTVHCFCRPASITANDCGLVRGWQSGGVSGYMGMVVKAAAPAGVILNQAKSALADSTVTLTGTTPLRPGIWAAVGTINNFAAKTQSIYINGKLDATGSASSWSSTTYVNTAPVLPAQIGTQLGAYPPGSTASFFDGLIAEVAVWKVALGEGEMNALGRGINPLMIRPASLIFYTPLTGRASPEVNLGSVGSAGNVTITGTMLEGPPPPALAFTDPAVETDAIRVPVTFIAAWARGANLPVLGTGNF